MTTNAESPSTLAQNYLLKTERDSSEKWPWLLDFLRGKSIGNLKEPYPTSYRIFDILSDTIKSKVFQVRQDEEVSQDFVQTLRQPIPKQGVRFIVVCYPVLQCTNVSYLAVLGETADIEPAFLAIHTRASNEAVWKFSERMVAARRFSDPQYLQIRFIIRGHATLMERKEETNETQMIIMLMEHNPEKLSDDPIHQGFLRELSKIKSYGTQDDQRPAAIEYTATLLEPLAGYYSEVIHHHADAIIRYGFDKCKTPDLLSDLVTENRSQSLLLEGILQTLSAALASSKWSTGSTSRTQKFHEEYSILLRLSNSRSQHLRDSVQQASNLLAMKETRKGLEQADAVRRLTLIALIFIPLNFATSFFGMNVQQLQTGSTHIGYFVLTALLTEGLAVLLSCEQRSQKRKQSILQASGLNTSTQKRDHLRFSRLGNKTMGAIAGDEDPVSSDGFRAAFSRGWKRKKSLRAELFSRPSQADDPEAESNF
ncbi:MAG: hypothetical protein Q9219_003163 [cf. Caloplaca sp. 3 TL-2023]